MARQAAILMMFVCMAMALAAAQTTAPAWLEPGQQTQLPAFSSYANERGQVGMLNTSGGIDTKGHPFFEPIGSNGRACVTCHQPADGMSLSLRSIRERWQTTAGRDPLFAAVDGMNCPSLPAADPRSH